MHQLSCINANDTSSWPLWFTAVLFWHHDIIPSQEFRNATLHQPTRHKVSLWIKTYCMCRMYHYYSKEAWGGVVGAKLDRLQEGNPTLFTSTPPLNVLCASHHRAPKHLVTCTFSIPECWRLSAFFSHAGESFNAGCQLLVSACQTVWGNACDMTDVRCGARRQ